MVDASLQEEACSLAQLLVSVNGENNICAMQKVGQGALDPDSIFEMIEVIIEQLCTLICCILNTRKIELHSRGHFDLLRLIQSNLLVQPSLI